MWNTVGADTGILSSLRQYGISIFLQSQKPYTMKKQKKKKKKEKELHKQYIEGYILYRIMCRC
jgi:hypothetical protein